MTMQATSSTAQSGSASSWSAPLGKRKIDAILRCQRQITEFFQSRAELHTTGKQGWSMTLQERDAEELEPMLVQLDKCVERADLPLVKLTLSRCLFTTRGESAQRKDYPKGYGEVLDSAETVGFAPALLPEWLERIESGGHQWPFSKTDERGKLVGCVGVWQASTRRMPGSRLSTARALARQLPAELGVLGSSKRESFKTHEEILLGVQRGQALLENLCRVPGCEMTWRDFDNLAKSFFISEEFKGDLAALLEKGIGPRGMEKAAQRKARPPQKRKASAFTTRRRVFPKRVGPPKKEPTPPSSSDSSSTASSSSSSTAASPETVTVASSSNSRQLWLIGAVALLALASIGAVGGFFALRR